MTADLTPAQAARLEAIEAAPYAEEAAVERVARAIYVKGAWCGVCGYDGFDACSECRRTVREYAAAAIDVMRGAADDGAIGRVLALCDDLDREGVVQLFHGPHNANQFITGRIRAAIGTPATAERDDDRG